MKITSQKDQQLGVDRDITRRDFVNGVGGRDDEGA